MCFYNYLQSNNYSPFILQLPYKDFITKLSKHMTECWHEPADNLELRRRLRDHSLSVLKRNAVIMAHLDFPTQGRRFLIDNFLYSVDGGFYCPDCGVCKRTRAQIRKAHQKGRKGRCAEGGFRTGLCYGSRATQDVLVPKLFTRDSLCNRFLQYLNYAQSQPGLTTEGIPNAPQGFVVPPTPLHVPAAAPAMASTSPTRPFSSRSSSTAIFDSFEQGVRSLPGHQEYNREQFLNELQSITTPCGAQAEVMNFAMDVYGSMALNFFGGSYSQLAHYLGDNCRDASDQWESNLVNAALRFMDQSHQQLVSVDTSLLIDATKTGKYDTKASAYRVNNTLRQYFHDVEHRTNDDGETVYMPTEEDRDILFERVRSLVEAADTSAGGMPKKLCRKSKATESHYRSDFGRFMLFFARTHRHFFDEPTNIAIANRLSIFASVTYNTNDGHEKALGVIATFTLLSLELPTDANYHSMVMKSHTLPGVYAMAKSIHVSCKQNRDYVYRLESPATTHGTTSSLLHTLRVGYVGCMVHATLGGDAALQERLPGVHVLCCSAAILELSTLSRVSKGYEQFLSTGIQPAEHRIEDGEDVFRIKQRNSTGAYLDLKRRHFRSALQRGCLLAEQNIEKLLLMSLAGKAIEIEIDGGGKEMVQLDPNNMEALLCGLFRTSAHLYEIGTHNQCVEQVRPAKRSRNGSVNVMNIQASTVSAKFFLRLPDGRSALVCSSELSSLLVQHLVDQSSFRSQYDPADFMLRTIFGALMQFSMRGTPRPWEMLPWKPGVTNGSTVKEFSPNLMVRSGSHPFASRLSCSFQRRKCGGTGVNDTGFMTLPESVGQLLCVFLSVFHAACADFLFGCSSQGTHARSFLASFFHKTDFSAVSPTYTKWPSLDDSICRCLEGLFGVPDKSLSLAIFRQVMCRVSTLQEAKMKERDARLVSQSRARGFNHGVPIHQGAYNSSLQLGNQLISVQQQSVNDRMDSFHHEWIGDTPLQPPVGAGEALLDDWRCPRLLSDSEALGFLLLCASASYQPRAPYQRMVLTESLSMGRDGLVIGPCGSGKTNAIIGGVLYTKLSAIIRKSDGISLHGWLSSRIKDQDLASSLMGNQNVKNFVNMCRHDKRPPAPNKFTLCVVPHASAAHELIGHINSMQLSTAVAFREDDLRESIRLACQAGDFPSEPFGFDVMVMTAAMAVRDNVRVLLEECFQKRFIYTLVLDEAHCFVTDISYMRCLGIVANLPRFGSPILALSGSLPRCLTASLASVLQSSFGICLSTWRRRCTIKHSHYGSTDNIEERLMKYIRNNGVWRPSNTVPTNVAHSICPIPSHSDAKTANLVKRMIERLDASGSGSPLQVEKILVVCGTTNMAKEVDRCLGDHSVLLLGRKSQSNGIPDESVDPDQHKTFREGWVEGTVRIGVGTTVVAQCINQPRCNLVICVDLLFNLITYLQASSRGGRSKQRSLCLCLYREKSLRFCCSRETDFTPYQFWGVDVESPMVRRTLSTESLIPVLQHHSKHPSCRRGQIVSQMDSSEDGEADADSIAVSHSVDTKWCCDICSPDIRAMVRVLFGQGDVGNGQTAHSTNQPLEGGDFSCELQPGPPTPFHVGNTQTAHSTDQLLEGRVFSCKSKLGHPTPLPENTHLGGALVVPPTNPYLGTCAAKGDYAHDIICSIESTAARAPVATPLAGLLDARDISHAVQTGPSASPNSHPQLDLAPRRLLDEASPPGMGHAKVVNHCATMEHQVPCAASFPALPLPAAAASGAEHHPPRKNPYSARPVVVRVSNPYLRKRALVSPVGGDLSGNVARSIGATAALGPASTPLPGSMSSTVPVTNPCSSSHSTVSPPPCDSANNNPHLERRSISYAEGESAEVTSDYVMTLPQMTLPQVTESSSSCQLRALLTVSDQRLLSCCVWHVPGVVPHDIPLASNPLAAHDCRQAFVSFLGKSGGVCYKCGDDPRHCRTTERQISTCRLGGLRFNGAYCAHCGVHNEVGDLHSTPRCPANRLWGLIIWAFRSKTGHRLMKAEWEQTSSRIICGGVPYPDIASFGRYSDGLRLAWQHCLHFLVANEMNNRHFWRCVVSLLERTRHLAKLRS